MSDVAMVANSLMRAVAKSGCIRATDEDAERACRIMREELRAFLFDADYADERSVTLTGGSGLAMASLTVRCISRIIAKRE